MHPIKAHPHQHKLYVIAVVSNPCRYLKRYHLYRKFEQEMKEAGAQLLTVECAFGDRHFEVTEAGNPMHVQLRTSDELWHKENMINIGISRLPFDWEYVAWIDADVTFYNKDWLNETLQQLQHHHVVQMFQSAIDYGPHGEVIQTHAGFGFSHVQRRCRGPGYAFWHPGFAWAASRRAINHLGGLIDANPCVLGSGDHSMALALVNRAVESYPSYVHENYKKCILEWERRAEIYIKRDIGFVPGTIGHFYHGSKKNRKYQERWQIIPHHRFDPYVDLKKDWQGLYQLNDNNIKLRDDIRTYFRQRNEDGNE